MTSGTRTGAAGETGGEVTRVVDDHHRVDGRRVRSRVLGPTGGDPRGEVVIVPGLGMSGRPALPLARALAAGGARVRVLDPPGCGASDVLPGEPTITDLATALARWLAVVVVPGRPAAVVGISLGSQVVVEAARLVPDLVARVVLLSPPFDRRARGTLRQLGRLVRTLPREQLGIVAVIGWDWLRAGPWRVARFARRGTDHPLERRVAGLAAPVLVVRGGSDPVAQPAWADEVARAAPQGAVAVVAGTGHGLHWTAPAAVARVLAPFLAPFPAPFPDAG